MDEKEKKRIIKNLEIINSSIRVIDQATRLIFDSINATDKIQPIAKTEELDKVIGEQKRFTATIMGFLNTEDFEKVSNILGDIACKDSIQYERDTEAMEIHIFDDDKDRLHKRAMWLVKKTDTPNIYYKVK
jgi:hypothetical protein